MRRYSKGITGELPQASTKVISRDTVVRIDPGVTSFRSINTPEEYRQMADSILRTEKGADGTD